MLDPTYNLPPLPPPVDLETARVFKALAAANRALAELKGRAAVIPNQGMLIDTLSLQEAKASSEIENIVTTHDELFRIDVFSGGPQSASAKEVSRYRDALKLGYERLCSTKGIISNNTLIDMFRLLKAREDGFRSTPGTALKSDQTGKIVYVPPQSADEIANLMHDLERFINDDDICAIDPLIKMTLIHHQFESIRPFPDGNGRIGRILNVLYITRTGLLDIPILYLSRHIIGTKSEYYRLLQEVRDSGDWENWVLYMLGAVAETAKTTLCLVEGIREQMASVKHRMRRELPKIYSQDLLNNLFRHPYTRIDFVMKELDISRQTAAKHLDKLDQCGFVHKVQAGRNNYYINADLVRLFLEASGE